MVTHIVLVRLNFSKRHEMVAVGMHPSTTGITDPNKRSVGPAIRHSATYTHPSEKSKHCISLIYIAIIIIIV